MLTDQITNSQSPNHKICIRHTQLSRQDSAAAPHVSHPRISNIVQHVVYHSVSPAATNIYRPARDLVAAQCSQTGTAQLEYIASFTMLAKPSTLSTSFKNQPHQNRLKCSLPNWPKHKQTPVKQTSVPFRPYFCFAFPFITKKFGLSPLC